MKKILVIGLVAFFCAATLCLAGAFDVQDQEANEIAQNVREYLGGDEFEDGLKLTYPQIKDFEWGGRLVDTDQFGATYLVFCEAKEANGNQLYYYYECKITSVNDNPDLMSKYRLEY